MRSYLTTCRVVMRFRFSTGVATSIFRDGINLPYYKIFGLKSVIYFRGQRNMGQKSANLHKSIPGKQVHH